MASSLENLVQSIVGLKRARWSVDMGVDGDQVLGVDLSMRPTPVAHSHATGEALVSNGLLGADIIRLAAGDGFVPHTHAGDHLLLVIGGEGTITCGGQILPTRAGDVFMIEGQVPHAVGAITDHVILAVGSPHRPIDAADRMTEVDYEEIVTDIHTLHCLICDLHSQLPDRLHQRGCPHCPCPECRAHLPG
jgi:quercetin dioxygenase-like cupin family protein